MASRGRGDAGAIVPLMVVATEAVAQVACSVVHGRGRCKWQ